MVVILLQYLGCLALLLHLVAGIAIDYCASNNLGVDNINYIYMSNGYCKDYCMQNGYAVAITQYLDCWCSNYVPGDTVSNSDCSTNCPGFPSEKCGGDGLYGYVIVGDVSGTQDSSTPTSTTSSTTSPTTSSTTSPTTSSTTSPPTTSSTPTTTSTSSPQVATLTTQVRVTNQVSETVKVTQTYMVTSAAVNSSPSQSSSSSISSSSSSSSSSPLLLDSDSSSEDSSELIRATTIYSIKTVNGSEQTQLVRTEYVTTVPLPTSLPSASSSASASADASSSSEDKTSNSFFDSKGKVAGTFTAVGVVVLGLVSGILYCCCCCGGGKHDDDFTDEENQYSSDELSIEKPTVPATFYNNQSKNSSPQLSSNLKRNSSSKSILSLFSPSNNANVGVGRTSSKKKLNPLKHTRSDLNNNDGGLMFPISEFDTRLDPNSMFLNTNESTKTLGDELDYSRRMLHITNPE